MADGALAGIRIVELGAIGPVPFAAMLLADMGAEVIRVERPGTTLMFPTPITHRGRPMTYADLKTPAHRDAVLALIASADAVIEGFRPGVLERIGLAPAELLARNPRLVIGRMTGWGQDGPLAQAAGHDINYIAVTGALAAVGPAERAVPPLNLFGDFGGGAMYLIAGVLAALLSAARTGRGQVVDAAMCDGALSMMTMFFEMADAGQWRLAREANLLDGGAPFYRVYRCADGLDVAVGAIEPQFRAALCKGLGIAFDELPGADDPAAWPAASERLTALFATRPRTEWLERFAGLDACVTPVLRLDEAAGDPHLAARGALAAVDGLVQPAPAPRLDGTPSRVRHDRESEIALADAVRRWNAD